MTRRTSVEAAFTRGAQKLGPVHIGLAVADHESEHFASAVLGDAGLPAEGLEQAVHAASGHLIAYVSMITV
ncbi:hypothetical protein ACIRG7_00030 [Streptomyces microflavus]|uniref:hypothetical protein n=1 Tax=Streptomyces microflavus TaxID=1919 RepID=UPI0038134274